MIKKYFLLVVLFSYTLNLQAQYTDDMESYTDGEPIIGGHWTDAGCGGGVGCALMSTSLQAFNGTLLSGLIPGDGTTDAVLDFGNKIFSEEDWYFNFWMYIPSDKEAYFVLQGVVPIVPEESFAFTYFNQGLTNPGVGRIEDTAIGTVFFNFPHDEWFKLTMSFNLSMGLSAATWEFIVDDTIVIPEGTAFTDGFGNVPNSLGGCNFSSISPSNEFYLDDIIFFMPQLNTNDNNEIKYTIYPNPVQNILNINTQESINSVTVYNILGSAVKNISQTKSIDVSNLTSGMYFIEVNTDSGKSIQKFIKK